MDRFATPFGFSSTADESFSGPVDRNVGSDNFSRLRQHSLDRPLKLLRRSLEMNTPAPFSIQLCPSVAQFFGSRDEILSAQMFIMKQLDLARRREDNATCRSRFVPA